jgi:hypothetical protein
VEILRADVDDRECGVLRQALEKKLGIAQSHKVLTVSNAFGASWPGEQWGWLAEDGAALLYSQHTKESSGCRLYAKSDAAYKRDQPEVVQP